MNLLFLNPPFMNRFSRTSRSPGVAKGGTLYYPLWLAYAVGVAEKQGFNVRFFDAPAEGLTLDDIFTHLNNFIPDLVIVDTSTASIYNDTEIAGRLKAKYPRAFMVLVGTHPSALPEDTLKLNDSIDAVCIGEYDYTIRDLARVIKNHEALATVDGIVFRDNGRVIKNKERAKIEDLDDIPFVSSVYKKYLNYRNYFFAAANYPMLMIIAGRGCPFRCFFCVYPQVFHSRRYRIRSAENVVDEFEYIKRNFPDVKEIGIEDDCFSANVGHVKKICELLIERKVRIKWYCNARGDLDYSLLKLMKKAGCRLVTVGFESGCQEILENMQKQETIQRYYKFAEDAKRAGILIHGCIMVGNPEDSKETLAKSYEFARKLNCDSMQFYPLYLYPGTEAFNWAKEKGYLKTNDFSQWLTKEGLHNCVLDIPGLSGEDMVSLCDYYLRKYHLRPLYILMKLKQAILNPQEGYRTFKAAKVFFSKLAKDQLRKNNKDECFCRSDLL